MSWERMGLVFNPKNRFDWMQTHAQLPVVIPHEENNNEEGLFKVFFASRDEKQRSQIGYIIININKPDEILDISEKPILEFGSIGCFDEHGVYPSSIIKVCDKHYMYYIGWNKGAEYPMFYASIGLAISEDGGRTFKKYSRAPILARSEYDPWMVTAPCVLYDGFIFRMYYVSGIRWERDKNNSLTSVYHTKYAESNDGVNWKREGVVSIDFENGEKNISRCCVIKEDKLYKSYFSASTYNMPYKLRYAESSDGMIFNREKSGSMIEPSINNFDAEMIAYPYVINHENIKYMFYNGNNMGFDGIGMAIWKA